MQHERGRRKGNCQPKRAGDRWKKVYWQCTTYKGTRQLAPWPSFRWLALPSPLAWEGGTSYCLCNPGQLAGWLAA